MGFAISSMIVRTVLNLRSFGMKIRVRSSVRPRAARSDKSRFRSVRLSRKYSLCFFKHAVGFLARLPSKSGRMAHLFLQSLPLFPADCCVFLCLVSSRSGGSFCVIRRRSKYLGHNPCFDGKMLICAVHHTVYGMIFRAHERHILPLFSISVFPFSVPPPGTFVPRYSRSSRRPRQCQHAYQDERRQDSFVCVMPDDVRFPPSARKDKHHDLPTKRNL